MRGFRLTLPGRAPSKYPPWASRRAAVVGWIWCHILRYGGELCQRCGRSYGAYIWWSPNDLWAEVSGAFPVRMSLVCPRCYVKVAEKAGVFVVFYARAAHRREAGGEWGPALTTDEYASVC